MTHPRYGEYSEPASDADVIDVERIASHPAARGGWQLEPTLAPGSVYRIRSLARPDLHVDVDDRADAEHVCDLLNLAASQLRAGWPGVAPAPIASRVTRAEAIGVLLSTMRAKVAALEAVAGDASAGRSVNQHAVAGAAEAQQHDALRREIDTLERELADLVGA